MTLRVSVEFVLRLQGLGLGCLLVDHWCFYPETMGTSSCLLWRFCRANLRVVSETISALASAHVLPNSKPYKPSTLLLGIYPWERR